MNDLWTPTMKYVQILNLCLENWDGRVRSEWVRWMQDVGQVVELVKFVGWCMITCHEMIHQSMVISALLYYFTTKKSDRNKT